MTTAQVFLGAMLLPALAAHEVVAQCEPIELARLFRYDTISSDCFGWSVDVSGDRAIVGAPYWDNQDRGAAYIFRNVDSVWVEEQALYASDSAPNDKFGGSVAISGDFAMVGAWWDDDFANASGSVYVYRWTGTNWLEIQKLHASDPQDDDVFSYAISLDGEVALISAVGDDEVADHAGAAYVFRYDGSNWSQEQKLTAIGGTEGDDFGLSLCIRRDVAIVGAWLADTLAEQAGAAYVFRFDGTEWQQESELLASDGEAMESFGYAVCIDGDAAVVTARGDDHLGTESGSAYAFRWNGSSWVEEQKLLASDGGEYQEFGTSVDIVGNRAVVGAEFVGGNRGAAYVYRFSDSTWQEQAKILPSVSYGGEHFGRSLLLDGDTAIVGAFGSGGAAYLYDLRCRYITPLTGYTVNRGMRTGGNLLSLMASDPYSLKIASEPGTVYHVSEITVKATSPVETPARLDLGTETRANGAFVQTRISLRNVNTNAWVQVAAFAQPQSDLVKILEDIPNPEDYVRASDGLIRIRVQMIRALSRGPFTMFVDHVQVTVYE